MNKFDKEKFKEFLDRDDLSNEHLFMNDDCEEITRLFSESCINPKVILKVMNDKELQLLLEEIVESDYINFRNPIGSEKEAKDGIIFFKNCVEFLEKVEVL